MNRTKGQVLIGCWCDEAFVQAVDTARGGESRSQFARFALFNALRGKVKTKGISPYAPDRTKRQARTRLRSNSASARQDGGKP